MRHSFRSLRHSSFPLLLALAAPASAANYILESSTLRLEVSPTYAYTLTEKSTGNVLLSQNLTTVTIGNSSFNATTLSSVTTTSTSLDGSLALGTHNTGHVNFTFASPDDLRITLTATSGTPASIAERFTDTGQHYYGVWENALPNSLDNRTISAGYDGIEPTGVTTKDVFAASARAPFFFTNNNYGIYTNTQAQGTYTFAQSSNTTMKFNTTSLQYDILHGTTPKAILAQHNAVAGPAFMPPDWAFDTILWRDDFHQLIPQNSAVTNAQQLILDDSAKLQANHIHAGGMWIDRPYGTGAPNQDGNVAGWGNMDFDSSFPNPTAMAQTLHDQGINLMLWIANKANNTLKTEGAADGYLFTGFSNSPAADLTDPNAYNWFLGKLGTLDNQALLSDGSSAIKGFKIDRGGEGEMPDALINTETTLFQQLARQNMLAQNPSDSFNFSRNVNGQGRQYAAVWSGDPKTTWLGLQTSIKNGLRSGLINFPMWGSDTGGYAGSAATQELFSRWVAFSAFSPMMEIIQGPGRNIFYDFSAQTINITQKFTDLHHDLIPYTRSTLATALANGTPIMRPMFIEFPNDSALADNSDQYMFGPNLLVAPVTTPGATSRPVYLPALPSNAKWLDYNDRKTIYAGAQIITASAPIDIIPTFIPEGAIIPRGDIVQGNNNWTPNWHPTLRIEIFPSANFPSSFDYDTGSAIQTITATPSAAHFQITAGNLLLPGQFDIYLTRPTSVFLNGTQLVLGSTCNFDLAANLLTVPFAAGTPLTLDINGTYSIFATFIPGDANRDGKVDISDLNTLAAHWQQPNTDWSQGDFNHDQNTNISDLNLLATNWQSGVGTSLTSSQLPTSLPEPASLILLLPALLLPRRRLLP